MLKFCQQNCTLNEEQRKKTTEHITCFQLSRKYGQIRQFEWVTKPTMI